MTPDERAAHVQQLRSGVVLRDTQRLAIADELEALGEECDAAEVAATISAQQRGGQRLLRQRNRARARVEYLRTALGWLADNDEALTLAVQAINDMRTSCPPEAYANCDTRIVEACEGRSDIQLLCWASWLNTHRHSDGQDWEYIGSDCSPGVAAGESTWDLLGHEFLEDEEADG